MLDWELYWSFECGRLEKHWDVFRAPTGPPGTQTDHYFKMAKPLTIFTKI